MSEIPRKPEPSEHVETLHVDIGLGSWSDERGNLFAALAKAQGQIANAKKGAVNSHFNSKYATLTSVIEATKGPFADNEIAVVQILGHTTIMEKESKRRDDYALVQTIVTHSSGEFMQWETTCRVADASPQKLGGGWTYLRRYSLCAIGQIGSEDDDGNDNIPGKTVAPENQKVLNAFYSKGFSQQDVERMIGKPASVSWSEREIEKLRSQYAGGGSEAWSKQSSPSLVASVVKKSGF